MATLLRTLSAAEAATLSTEVEAAVERGTCDSLDLPLPSDQTRYLRFRARQFQRQYQFLGDNGLMTHPCVRIGGEPVPVSFSLDDLRSAVSGDSEGSEGRVIEILSRDTSSDIEMVNKEEIKRIFSERFVEFVKCGLEWTGFSGSGGGGGDRNIDEGSNFGEAGGMQITVNSNTHGLQVVYSEHFLIRGKRSENAFGETLTSPVTGIVTQPGLYYFGTADNDSTNWSRFTFKIPPTRTVNLMH
ncbi:MAG: hypothetical protein ACJ8ER_01255 [Allosphingosinicella sp.]